MLDDAGGRFAIIGGNLVVAGGLDFEGVSSHDVTVRVTDRGGLTYREEIFTISVTNANEAPTDIACRNAACREQRSGDGGRRVVCDRRGRGRSATYSLIDSAGGRFAISGSNLVVAGSLDYETATSHQVTVLVTDAGGLTHQETFTINVTNDRGGRDPGRRR